MQARSRSTFLTASIALALAANAPARAQTSRLPLRVGMGPSDAYAEAWYAADAGFFQKAGLNVDVQGFNSGAVSTAAIVAGTLDISGTSTLPIVNAVARGIPLVIIAAAAVNTVKSPQAVMVVRNDGSVRSPKDLIDKTVGMNVLRTASELALDAWLVKNSVDAARVKKVEVLASEMGLALERGRIDAFIAGEPALSAALQGKRVHIFADPMSAIAPRYLYAAWCTTASFLSPIHATWFRPWMAARATCYGSTGGSFPRLKADIITIFSTAREEPLRCTPIRSC